MEIRKTLYFVNCVDFKSESFMQIEPAQELLSICERGMIGTSRIYEFNTQKIAILNPEVAALTVFEGAAADIAELIKAMACPPVSDVVPPAPGEKGALRLP